MLRSMRDRRLDETAVLPGRYRTRFFLRMAVAEAPALVGFVAYFLTYDPAMYLLGAAIAAWRLVWVAPTAAHLADDQQELATSGCGRSLSAALAAPPPTV